MGQRWLLAAHQAAACLCSGLPLFETRPPADCAQTQSVDPLPPSPPLKKPHAAAPPPRQDPLPIPGAPLPVPLPDTRRGREGDRGCPPSRQRAAAGAADAQQQLGCARAWRGLGVCCGGLEGCFTRAGKVIWGPGVPGASFVCCRRRVSQAHNASAALSWR